MFQKALSNPLISPLPLCSPKHSSPNHLLIVRSHVADSSQKAESGLDQSPDPSKLFEKAAVSMGKAGAYPGGMGLHTGRDPNVKKPEWLRQRAPQGEKFTRLQESLSKLKLNTVCVEAQCPNIGEVLKLCRSDLKVAIFLGLARKIVKIGFKKKKFLFAIFSNIL